MFEDWFLVIFLISVLGPIAIIALEYILMVVLHILSVLGDLSKIVAEWLGKETVYEESRAMKILYFCGKFSLISLVICVVIAIIIAIFR